jgi:hypothetical protein
MIPSILHCLVGADRLSLLQKIKGLSKKHITKEMDNAFWKALYNISYAY